MTVPAGAPITHHLGFAVYDADSAARRYESILGAEMRLRPPYHLTDLYDRPAELRVYYGAIAGIALEIIQVVSGYTCQSEWLQHHGEGIQHIGLWVPDVAQATREAIARGARIEWIYNGAPGGPTMAGISAGSKVDELLERVSNDGLVYLDIKHGGAQIEYIGPRVQSSAYGPGGALEGLAEVVNRRPPGQEA